ncbi:MAG: hypothetical protein OXR68_03250 [Alphaproteobacteria bacterium]|nr:hypothetical protein [Alphaproteobacteria bacterium]
MNWENLLEGIKEDSAVDVFIGKLKRLKLTEEQANKATAMFFGHIILELYSQMSSVFGSAKVVEVTSFAEPLVQGKVELKLLKDKLKALEKVKRVHETDRGKNLVDTAVRIVRFFSGSGSKQSAVVQIYKNVLRAKCEIENGSDFFDQWYGFLEDEVET